MSEVPEADHADQADAQEQQQDARATVPEEGGADLDRLERDLGDGAGEGDGSSHEK